MHRLYGFASLPAGVRRPVAKPLVISQGPSTPKTSQQRAREKLNRAVRAGRSPRPTTLICVDCGKPAREYDHRDYSKPFAVAPVCKACNARRGPGIVSVNQSFSAATFPVLPRLPAGDPTPIGYQTLGEGGSAMKDLAARVALTGCIRPV